jgi:hypothetical protein
MKGQRLIAGLSNRRGIQMRVVSSLLSIIAVAGAVSYHSNAVAGPTPASMAALSSMIPNDVVDVRYCYYCRRPSYYR